MKLSHEEIFRRKLSHSASMARRATEAGWKLHKSIDECRVVLARISQCPGAANAPGAIVEIINRLREAANERERASYQILSDLAFLARIMGVEG